MQDLRKNYWGAESFCVQRSLVYYCEVLKDSEGIRIVVFLPEKMQFLSEKTVSERNVPRGTSVLLKLQSAKAVLIGRPRLTNRPPDTTCREHLHVLQKNYP